MALNPPLSPDGTPLRVAGELFVLLRKNMEFEIKIAGVGKLTGEGDVRFLAMFCVKRVIFRRWC